MEITKKEAKSFVKLFAYNYFNAIKINAFTSSLMNKYIDDACNDIENNGYLDMFNIIARNILTKSEVFKILNEVKEDVLIKCDWTEEAYFTILDKVDNCIREGLNGLKSKISTDFDYCDYVSYSDFDFKLKEGE